jgi:hypothetical protein
MDDQLKAYVIGAFDELFPVACRTCALSAAEVKQLYDSGS